MSCSTPSFLRPQADIPAAATYRHHCGIERFPAGLVLSIDTDDFDEFREHALGWDIDHQLIGTKRPRSSISGVFTPSVQVAIVQHAMGYCAQGRNPQGFLTFVGLLDEVRPMIYRGDRIELLEMPLIGAEGYEVVCSTGAHFLTVSIAQNRVEQYAADVAHRPQLWRGSGDRLRFWNSSHQVHSLDALTRILMAVRTYPVLLNEQQNAALLEEKLLESLPLEACAVSRLAEDRIRYKVARHAYRYLQDRIDAVPSISDLCVITGASYATLERGFRETYGMTPKAFIGELRLSRARSALLHPTRSTTVTAVALRFGFLEFSRFSLRYRQRFGETPRETLRKALGES